MKQKNCFICRQCTSVDNFDGVVDEGLSESFAKLFSLPFLIKPESEFRIVIPNTDFCQACGWKLSEAMRICSEIELLEVQLKKIKEELQTTMTRSYGSRTHGRKKGRSTPEEMGSMLSQCWIPCRVVVRRIDPRHDPNVERVEKLCLRAEEITNESADYNVKPLVKTDSHHKHVKPPVKTGSDDKNVKPSVKSESIEDEDVGENYAEDDRSLNEEETGMEAADDEDWTLTESGSTIVGTSSDLVTKTAPKTTKPVRKLQKKSVESSYVCQTCFKCCEGRSSLKSHLRNEHGLELRLLCKYCQRHFSSNSTETGETSLQCDYEGCKKLFKNIKTLREHHEKKCIKNPKRATEELGLKLFKCDQCDKTYTRANCLRFHVIKIHKQSFNVYCHVCGEGFVWKCWLDRHMRSKHSEEKPFVCEECGLSFKRKEQLVCHRRRHTGETPYVCEQCGKGFIRVQHLHLHKRNIHSQQLVPCPLCKKQFRSKQYVYNHVETVHKGRNFRKNKLEGSKKGSSANDKEIFTRPEADPQVPEPVQPDSFVVASNLS